jgi:hypothetical protein
MLRPKFPARLLNQQDLAIDHIVHGVPSLGVSILVAAGAAVEAVDCPHLLRMTLVGGRSFHNGRLWQTHQTLKRVASLPDSGNSGPPEIWG